MKKLLAGLLLGLMVVGGVVFAATDQNASVSYQIEIGRSVRMSTTVLTSSDTSYQESDCIGGMGTLAVACAKSTGRAKRSGLVYKVMLTNAGTATVDVTVFFFSRSITSPGDNEPFAITDDEWRGNYIGRVDLPQTARQEASGDAYAEAVEVNLPYHCTSDGNIYFQLVKNNVGPVDIGGDTRSATADTELTVLAHQFGK